VLQQQKLKILHCQESIQLLPASRSSLRPSPYSIFSEILNNNISLACLLLQAASSYETVSVVVQKILGVLTNLDNVFNGRNHQHEVKALPMEDGILLKTIVWYKRFCQYSTYTNVSNLNRKKNFSFSNPFSWSFFQEDIRYTGIDDKAWLTRITSPLGKVFSIHLGFLFPILSVKGWQPDPPNCLIFNEIPR